ncbi:MAG: T9SS type A sorting domain-containing protein [Bacteroidales bacterium]|nr:T9SS type A sorting domain-containing protein [Bacteroidales bacterium]
MVAEGEDQTFTFSAEADYSIDKVLVDGVNNTQALSDGYYTFENVSENHTMVVVVIPLSIDAYSVEIKVYPNPTVNYINIESDEIIEELIIFNSAGKKI